MSRMNEPNAPHSKAMRESAEQVQQGLRDMGSHAREAAAEQYKNIRDQARDMYDEGRERAMEWEHSLERYVQEKPIQSLLIAAGVGLLLGMLWKRS